MNYAVRIIYNTIKPAMIMELEELEAELLKLREEAQKQQPVELKTNI